MKPKVPPGLKKVAAMCILRSGDQYMLLERYNEPNKGMYVPVGGKVEPYESPLWKKQELPYLNLSFVEHSSKPLPSNITGFVTFTLPISTTKRYLSAMKAYFIG